MKTMFLAEIDPFQIAIIVIAMLGGFVQWLWGLFKQGQEEAARRRAAPPSAEEKKLRQQAWRRQVQQPASPPPLRPSPKSTQPAHDPWATVRDVFEQIKKEVTQPQTPPPLQRPAVPPYRTRPGTVRAEVQPPPPVPVNVPVVEIAPKAVAPPVHAAAKTDGFALLRGLLANQAAIRQAVLMREILGPPKALQSSVDSAF